MCKYPLPTKYMMYTTSELQSVSNVHICSIHGVHYSDNDVILLIYDLVLLVVSRDIV